MITARIGLAGERGMVATKHPLAAAAGVRVLREGGNAVDAAVATAFALGVIEPWMSGIGGGGFLIYRSGTDGHACVIDFSMVAPGAARPDMFPLDRGGAPEPELPAWPRTVDRRQAVGPLAVAVPGTAAGLAAALRKHGTIDLAAALAPAIAFAEEGWPLDWSSFLQISLSTAALAADPAMRAMFFAGDHPFTLRNETAQPLVRLADLARTLKRIAADGVEVLYRGELARTIARSVGAAGGILAEADLAAYQALERAPLEQVHAGMTVLTTPSGSGGPAVAATLRGLGADRGEGPRSPESVRRFARAARAAMDDHVSGAHRSAGSTTHVSVIDRERNMVALTSTLHSRFGAYFAVPGTGVLLNNGMLWFDPRPGQPFSVVPAARPPTNMAPTLVVDGQRAFATLGASGGRRIPAAVAQLVHDLVVHGLKPQEAISLPRVDASAAPLLADERLGASVLAALRADRHEVVAVTESPYPQYFASPVAILADHATGTLHGGADPFSSAACAAY